MASSTSLNTSEAGDPASRPATPAPARNVRSLSGLWPFLRPYRVHMALAVVFLVMAAAAKAM